MKGRIVAAHLLLIIGVAWLLDMTGRTIFPGGIGTWWPSIVILVGLVGMVLNPREWRGSAILVLVGATLQAWTLGYLRDEWWAYLAPVALIVVGVLLLLPPYRRHRAEATPQPSSAPGSPTPPSSPPSKLGPEDVAVFRGHRFDAREGEEYKGGELTAVFGSLDADLTRAKLPPEGARLKATSVFGGVKVRVPADWRVEVHGTPVLGKTENRTSASATGPKLDVEAVAVFGDVTVTSA